MENKALLLVCSLFCKKDVLY